ncbi:RHS repeat-associated core domain-containing protein, partial [Myxococcota bacterium]|nr:RHS repeat-associated core domain-containing protein [Myxococcota bacterium]
IDNRTNPLWIDSEPDRIFNIAMTYDGFNQLLSTSYTYSDPGKLYDGRMFRYMEYDYDILGNLVKKITTRHLDTDSVPVDNPPDEFYKTWFGTATYGTGTAGPDAMSSAGDSAGNTIAIGYDGAGNMTTLTINKSGEITEYNYEWDEFNRLKQASRTGGPVGTPDYDATYFYDYGSVRVGKVEEKDSVTEHTLYINEAVEERWNGTSYNLVRYIFDGSRLARLDISGTTTTRRWMHPDHLGTTGCITKDGDPEGQAETITLYLPYGAVLEEKSETGFRDPYGFTGKELEVDLGIMYFGARWYNPQLGRWLSPDPLYLVSTAKNAERQQNLYEYASNNPWKFVDPNGLDEDKANSNMSSVHGMDKNSKIVISTQYDEQFNAINKHLVGLGYTNIERLGYNRVEIKNKDGKGTGVYNYNKASKAGKDKLVSTQLQAAEGLIFMGHHGPEEGIGVFYNGSSNDKLRIDFNKLKLPNLKVIVSDVCRVHQELKCKKQKKLLVGYDIIKKSAPNLKLSLMMYSRAARYSISKDSQKNGSFGTMLVRSFFNPHFTGSPWKWCLKAITSISGSPKGYWGGDNNVERSVVLRNLSPGEKFFSFNYKNKQMEFYPNLYPSQLPRPLGSWWSK